VKEILSRKKIEPLRAALFVPVLYPWVIDLREALRKRVKSAEAYSLGIFGNYPEWKILEKDANIIPFKTFFGERIPNFRKLIQIFKEPKDLIILSATETASSMFLIFLARLKRTPAVLIVEENIDLRKQYPIPIRLLGSLKKPIIRLVHRNADILLPETEASKKYLLDMKCPLNKIQVIPHGINIGKYKPSMHDQDFIRRIGLDKKEMKTKLKVFYGGGFYKHKGIDVIIKLLEDDKFSNNFLLIIPAFGDNIDDYRAKLSKFKQVNLQPQFSHNEMKKILSIVDIVLVPSVSINSTERSPNIIIESMAAGKVVIASDMGGIPTFIDDAGILVPEGDHKAISESLKKFSENKKLITKYSNKARSFAVETLNSDVYSDKIIRIYLDNEGSKSKQLKEGS
jgi:glycosyltransferase involved in cell wall biosynthesis